MAARQQGEASHKGAGLLLGCAFYARKFLIWKILLFHHCYINPIRMENFLIPQNKPVDLIHSNSLGAEVGKYLEKNLVRASQEHNNGK